jgi:hypothetical protein
MVIGENWRIVVRIVDFQLVFLVGVYVSGALVLTGKA